MYVTVVFAAVISRHEHALERLEAKAPLSVDVVPLSIACLMKCNTARPCGDLGLSAGAAVTSASRFIMSPTVVVDETVTVA